MEFTWWLDYEEKDEVVIVEQGFITDFGSIPRLLWWILNPTEWVSFLLHDNMYQYHIVNNEQ